MRLEGPITTRLPPPSSSLVQEAIKLSPFGGVGIQCQAERLPRSHPSSFRALRAGPAAQFSGACSHGLRGCLSAGTTPRQRCFSSSWPTRLVLSWHHFACTPVQRQEEGNAASLPHTPSTFPRLSPPPSSPTQGDCDPKSGLHDERLTTPKMPVSVEQACQRQGMIGFVRLHRRAVTALPASCLCVPSGCGRWDADPAEVLVRPLPVPPLPPRRRETRGRLGMGLGFPSRWTSTAAVHRRASNRSNDAADLLTTNTVTYFLSCRAPQSKLRQPSLPPTSASDWSRARGRCHWAVEWYYDRLPCTPVLTSRLGRLPSMYFGVAVRAASLGFGQKVDARVAAWGNRRDHICL